MTVNSPPEINKTRPAYPTPFQRNKFSQSFSVSRDRTPRQRPIRTSPMSDFLYSPTTATHVPASPYSSFFGSNDKTDDNRSNENKLLLSPASTSNRTSKVKSSTQAVTAIHMLSMVFGALSFIHAMFYILSLWYSPATKHTHVLRFGWLWVFKYPDIPRHNQICSGLNSEDSKYKEKRLDGFWFSVQTWPYQDEFPH